MKMKSILLLMLALCLTLCLCACGDDTATDNQDNKTTVAPSVSNNASVPGTTTTTDSNDTIPSTPILTGPTQPVNGKANYTVIVKDEAGNPMSNVFVQLCLDTCVFAPTDAQGVATFYSKDVADYKVCFLTVPDGYVLPVDENGDPVNYYYEEDTYEMTLVLKKAA